LCNDSYFYGYISVLSKYSSYHILLWHYVYALKNVPTFHDPFFIGPVKTPRHERVTIFRHICNEGHQLMTRQSGQLNPDFLIYNVLLRLYDQSTFSVWWWNSSRTAHILQMNLQYCQSSLKFQHFNPRSFNSQRLSSHFKEITSSNTQVYIWLQCFVILWIFSTYYYCKNVQKRTPVLWPKIL